MAIEFLALPDEQRPWLKSVLKEEGVWCWVRMRGGGSEIISEPEDIDHIDFKAKNLIELDFGKAALMSPVFKKTGYGTDLDFPRSLAVQFAPSLAIDGCMLTVGQLAISSRGWYEFYGMNSDPVFEWYHKLSRSWKKGFCDDSMVIVMLDDGRASESRWVHLTPGAIAWWKEGKELRNLTNMTFKYDVVPRTPRGKSTR